MKSIYKYGITPDHTTLQIPGWRSFLSVGYDLYGELCVWGYC